MDILLVGVGGLGGHFLYALASSKENLITDGTVHVCILDHDTVSLHTTSRHPIFSSRAHDVGSLKASSAAAWLRSKRPEWQVTYVHDPVDMMPLSFFKKFTFVICAVDNLEARRFVNAACCQAGSPVLIEGGTEGWMGHARIVYPGTIYGCLECDLSLYHKQRQNVIAKCSEPENEPGDQEIIVSAPFVNAFTAGLMLALLTSRSKTKLERNFYFYNAISGDLTSCVLERNPECAVCTPHL